MPIQTNLKSLAPSKQQYKQEIVLLSKGYASREAFPEGKITVFPWEKEHDDWLLLRLRKPKRHLILWELTEQLCNLNGCPISEFVVGDVNTVLLVARSIMHKNVVRYRAVCSNCGSEAQEDEVRVPDELEKIGEKSLDYPGFDIITLPESQDKVRTHPLKVKETNAIHERTEDQRKAISDELAHTLSGIETIGDGKPDSIQELLTWWKALHPIDKEFFVKQRGNLFPHLSTSINHQCDSCGSAFTHQLNLDTNFFRAGVQAST